MDEPPDPWWEKVCYVLLLGALFFVVYEFVHCGFYGGCA